VGPVGVSRPKKPEKGGRGWKVSKQTRGKATANVGGEWRVKIGKVQTPRLIFCCDI